MTEDWTELDRIAKTDLDPYFQAEFHRYKEQLRREGHTWEGYARDLLSKFILKCKTMTNTVKLPSNLRPATAEDIKVGAHIWYPQTPYSELFHAVVEEVLCPNDQWKAYTADDGCRYGLNGAMVEIKAEANTPKATAEDLIKARAEMENRIKSAVQRIVADFEADTGLTPSSIHIITLKTQEFGARRNRYIITDVETSVTI